MYDKNNIFAKIIRREISSELIYEDDDIVALHDLYPVAPIHLLVIPKGHYTDYLHFIKTAPGELQLHFFTKVADLAQEFCGEHFRLCTNNGSDSGQTIFHFHIHIIGGKQLGGL
jgi:histidine triad (HIT) family protein